MKDKSCCCKHKQRSNEENCQDNSSVAIAVGTSLLPHVFCCFMPILFTAIIGGGLAVFFHDYWFVVTAIVAFGVSFAIYAFGSEKLSIYRVGGNVALALVVAFFFNVLFHPSHGEAKNDGTHIHNHSVEAHVHNH